MSTIHKILENTLYDHASKHTQATEYSAANAQLNALKDAGFMVVPVVATEKMATAGFNALKDGKHPRDCWGAMINEVETH